LTCMNLFVALSVRRRMLLVIIRKPRESRTSDYSSPRTSDYSFLPFFLHWFYPLFILAVLKALGTCSWVLKSAGAVAADFKQQSAEERFRPLTVPCQPVSANCEQINWFRGCLVRG
jgi:hypothetical protein